MRRNLSFLPLAVAGAIVAALLVLGRLPQAAGLLPTPWDKLAHLVTYGALAVCLRRGIPGSSWKIVVLLTVAVGMLDEVHQAFIPGRIASIADFSADVCGALAGAVMCGFIGRSSHGIIQDESGSSGRHVDSAD